MDACLRHLLYLVDADALVAMALGTYDLELVVVAAEKSQKDPKEYLPFLNQLRQMDEHYRAYRIEMHLQRFSLALSRLAQCQGRSSHPVHITCTAHV